MAVRICNVWVCVCGFSDAWVCVYVGFVMCGCGYVWVLKFVGFVCVDVVMCGCVGFLMCVVYVWVL